MEELRGALVRLLASSDGPYGGEVLLKSGRGDNMKCVGGGRDEIDRKSSRAA